LPRTQKWQRLDLNCLFGSKICSFKCPPLAPGPSGIAGAASTIFFLQAGALYLEWASDLATDTNPGRLQTPVSISEPRTFQLWFCPRLSLRLGALRLIECSGGPGGRPWMIQGLPVNFLPFRAHEVTCSAKGFQDPPSLQ
jgi:hypothetical protein